MQPLPGMSSGRTVTPRQILADVQSQPHYIPGGGMIDATYAYDGGNTDYVYELREGTIMARITASRQWCPCKRTKANGVGNGATSLIVDDARAFKAAETISITSPQDVVRVGDSDSASSTGVALYLHVDELGEGGDFGHFEAVTAGNADSYFETVGGGKVRVEDDDAAATLGVAVYFDEDATNPDERFLATTSTGKDAFVWTTDGRAIRIKYHAAPGTPGVQVYFDDDGSGISSNRLLFVSPTNANGQMLTDDQVGNQNLATLSSSNTVSAIDYATNTLTITAASWCDEAQVFADGIAGAEIPRAILNEVVNLIDTNLNPGKSTTSPVDVYTGKLIDQGNLLRDRILGDIDACMPTEYSGSKLAYINLYDDGVMV